jgi:simple sugar transport system permease protein
MTFSLRDTALRLSFALVSIALSLFITALLILLLGGSPTEVFESAWAGAFRTTKQVGTVFNFWIPLTLAAVGLVITFTAGLWNIGIEGQMMMGAIFASWGAQFLPLPQPILIPVCLSLAAIGGMLWAVLTGILKTKAGVNEIFGGVALNAIANNIAIYLIAGPWQPPEGGSAQSTPDFPAASNLPIISDDFQVSLLLLLLTIGAIIVTLTLLQGTRLGLALKATGKNPKSALLLGVATQRTALLAFALCGILGGIAGAYRVLHTYQAMRPLVTGGIGFLGLLVVLLVGYRLILVPFATFALAALIAGSTRVQIMQKFDQSLVGVLQGLLVLILLLMNGVRERWFTPPPRDNA